MEATEGGADDLWRKFLSCSRRAADGKDDEEQSATLHRMIHLSRSPKVRDLLATHDAVPTLLFLITQSPSSLILLLRLLRNLCAGSYNQEAFLRSSGPESVAVVVDKALDLLSQKKQSEMASILQVCLQLLGNACGGGNRQKEAVWMVFFPERFRALALLKGEDKVLEPLCMVLYTCSHGDVHKSRDLCHGEGAHLVSSCLQAAASHGVLCTGAADWVSLLISELCLRQPLLPLLFSNLGVLSKDGTQEPLYSEEQASLLGYLLDILAEKTQAPIHEDAIDLLGLIDFLAQTLQIASGSSRDTALHIQTAHDSISISTALQHGGMPTIEILGYTLELLKILSAWDHCCKNDRSLLVAKLLHQGVIKLCIELLKGLGPPDLIYKAMQSGNVEVTEEDRDIAPGTAYKVSAHEKNKGGGLSKVTRATLPYKGYRRDLVAVLGNASYQNRAVQDEVRNLGGLYLILQQCVVDEANSFLREWGLWAVRNLVDENLENCKEIAELQLRGSLTPGELAEMGYKVEMDPVLRRPKLVNIPPVRE